MNSFGSPPTRGWRPFPRLPPRASSSRMRPIAPGRESRPLGAALGIKRRQAHHLRRRRCAFAGVQSYRVGAGLPFEQDGGGLYQISAFGGQSVLVAPGGRNGHYSADGRWLAYWKGEVGSRLMRGSARTYIVPAHGGPPEEFPPGFDMAAYPVWSPTGNSILFFGAENRRRTWDWWIAKLGDKTIFRTGALERLRGAKADFSNPDICSGAGRVASGSYRSL